MISMEIPKTPKFICEHCCFKTHNRKDYTRHTYTTKHQKITKGYENGIENTPNTPKKPILTCDCGRIYKYSSGLYRHKKQCKFQESNTETDKFNNDIDEIDYKKLLLEFIKDNKELQKTLIEILPKIGNTVNNTINNNNNININLFLDEKCKNAVTMNDFVNNLTVSFDDLEITKEKGLCQGIINILTKNLKQLSVYERPMHCTDIKRETVYIKSAGDIIGGKEEPAKWEKDDNNRLLKQAIDRSSHIQRLNLKLWTEKRPNWKTDSNEQTEYMTLVRNSMEDIKEQKYENKVIKTLCGMTHFDGKKG